MPSHHAQITAIAAHLAANPAPTPKPFTLSNADRERLSGLNDVCRRDELGLLIYAHLWRETARCSHVAVLSHGAEMALQRLWQAEREYLITQAERLPAMMEAAE